MQTISSSPGRPPPISVVTVFARITTPTQRQPAPEARPAEPSPAAARSEMVIPVRHSRTRLSAAHALWPRSFADRPDAAPQRRHGEPGRQRRVPLAAIILSSPAGRILFAVQCRLVIVALGALPRARVAPPTPRGCDRFFRTPRSRCSRRACKTQPSFGVLVRGRPSASRVWVVQSEEGCFLDRLSGADARPSTGFTPPRAEQS